MADEADIANDYFQAHLDFVLKHRLKIDVKESANECVECGFQIPSERQIAAPGCQLCIDCARKLEGR